MYHRKNILFNLGLGITLVLFVFVFSSSLVAQVQIGDNINGMAEWERSGWSVSMSSEGTRVAIGSLFYTDESTEIGLVRVYEFSGMWNQLGSDIDGLTQGDDTGRTVSLSSDGNRLAIGTPQDGDNPKGHVRVFELVAGDWTQLGSDIDGESEGDFSGWAVSLSSDGNRLAICQVGLGYRSDRTLTA